METTPATTDATTIVSEAAAIALEIARDYKRHVEYFRREMGLSPAEADAKASELVIGSLPEVQRWVAEKPARELTWHDFNIMADHNPELVSKRWNEVKQEARVELDCGAAAYEPIKAFNETGLASLWERARFMAIHNALVEAWAPANGVECLLIDTMAQAQTLQCYWLEALGNYTLIDQLQSRPKRDSNDEWAPPRVTTFEALQMAAAMIDRFNRLFLRTLRQLRDLRRYSSAVTIQSAGQVNIGGAQLNVSAAEAKGEARQVGQVVDVSPAERTANPPEPTE